MELTTIGVQAQQRGDHVVVARLRGAGKTLDEGGRAHPAARQVRRREQG
ncbi:hypothetical protein [Cellulomonas soli]